MRTTTLVPRAVLLFGLIALVATQTNAEGPTLPGLSGWPPGSNNNQYPDPNSNNNDNNDSGNSTDNGDDSSDGNENGSGNTSGSGSGAGVGSGGYGNNNGGEYGGGYNGGFGNSGGSSSPFGPELNGLNDGLEYASLASYRVAHGVIASIAFAFLFPLGAILLRTIPNKAAFDSHWAIQVIASALYLIAAGLGLYLLSIIRIPSGAGLLDIAKGNAHPIIGIVLLVALFFQPIFGIVHHRRFKKLQKRTWVSHVHLWLGRLGITLGIINGGLGLALAGVKGAPVVAYAVISGIMWSLWVLATLFGAFKASRERKEKEVMAKIYQDNGEYVARVRGGSGTVAPHMENTVTQTNDSTRSYDAPVSMAEQDIPSPPYEPGPNYAAHMAHATLQRQRQFGRGEMQNIKDVMDGADSVSIISASQDEMRRGQV